ncbi:hypothetical protein ACOMHN_011672 [Nucella lapillus]
MLVGWSQNVRVSAQPRREFLDNIDALRALRIAEQVERSGACFASEHRPRAAQPFLPRYGASAVFSAVCGCFGDWWA